MDQCKTCQGIGKGGSVKHTCIINGEIVPYGVCAEVNGNTPPSHIYEQEHFEYFGTGNIYEIFGKFQGTGFGPYHFYRRVS